MRKTTGKVLQALFNSLGDMRGKAFLDLFSGSGQVADEAWRRGARPVIAVEADRRLCSALRAIAEGKEEFKIFCLDVRRALPNLKKKEYSFTVVFADPPYGQGWVAELLSLFLKYGDLLGRDSLLVIERSKREEMPSPLEGWELSRERNYGDTVLSFLKKKEDL